MPKSAAIFSQRRIGHPRFTMQMGHLRAGRRMRNILCANICLSARPASPRVHDVGESMPEDASCRLFPPVGAPWNWRKQTHIP
jgi:hypothetical protein